MQLISRDLLKQRHIKNHERFIARRFGVIVCKSYANKEKYKISTEITTTFARSKLIASLRNVIHSHV